MTNHQQDRPPAPPNLGEVLRLLLRGIRLSDVLIAGATLAIVAGVALNWSVLVAAGLAPLILVLLACGAMCVIPWRMKRGQGSDGRDGKPPSDDKPGSE